MLKFDPMRLCCELNGAYVLSGTGYTTAAILAQTAGIPINTFIINQGPINAGLVSGDYLFPGACAIGDILAGRGYNQVFRIGSDGTFGSRAIYFEEHGGYTVEDYHAAIEEGKIPEDYYVWWGYEDEKLIE